MHWTTAESTYDSKCCEKRQSLREQGQTHSLRLYQALAFVGVNLLLLEPTSATILHLYSISTMENPPSSKSLRICGDDMLCMSEAPRQELSEAPKRELCDKTFSP